MIHYLAMLWNDRDSLAREEAAHLFARLRVRSREWSTSFSSEGMSVFTRTDSGTSPIDRSYALDDGQGVVLGQLFSKNALLHDAADQRVRWLDASATAAIVATRGRTLIDDYWGRYVAFVRDRQGEGAWVLRDPSGGIPCQYTRIGRIHIYFVRLQDSEQLGAVGSGINHHYLLGYLLFDSVCVSETGVADVETVLAGECVEHRRELRRHHFYWDPLRISQADVVEGVGECVKAMRATVRGCVNAWASCFPGMLLELSGGLDSSIVLSCLARAPSAPRLVSRHNFSNSGDADERAFARAAAERFGCELIEHCLSARFQLPDMHQASRALSPFPSMYDARVESAEEEWMRSRGLDAKFTGNGGDEVFFRGGPMPTAVDFAWRHGIGRRLMGIAVEDAVSSQVSVWQVLRSVYRYGLVKRSWHPRDAAPPQHIRLMKPEVKSAASRDYTHWHPLYRQSVKMEPGKLLQAYLFTFGTASGHVPGASLNAPAYINPLLSQPLLELSLKIPVYVLCAGGRDRAIARDAFAVDLPPQIARRKSKAFGDRLMEEIIVANIGYVRSLLLDGYLVREGIVDRAKLEQALSGDLAIDSPNILEIGTYIDIESWCHGWSRSPARAAA